MSEQTSFKDAYGVLTRHAQTLRDQQDPNIDDLLKIVNESMDAYKVCKARIDAVEQALEQALGTTEVEPHRASPVAAQPVARQATAAPDDDDVPF